MGGLLLPIILLIGGYIYYEKFGGKQQLDSILGNLKGGGDSSGNFNDLIKQAQSRKGSWTDEKGNHFNNQSDTNTQSNVGGNGKISQKQSNVFYTIPRFGNL